MPDIEKFETARSRGIVWVCDLANSSRYLNDDKSAETLEEFLPRLYWVSSMAVEAAGGRFIKWTGDGFLAWFETSLYRQLGEKAAPIFEAAWHLTTLVNVTQLGINSERKFKIRHGITYEQDALLTTITHPGGYQSLDIMGRAIVLAFRLSGIDSAYPSIVSQSEIIKAIRHHIRVRIGFKKLNLKPEDKLRYFKGEAWGTKSIYTSTKPILRTQKLSAMRKKALAVIAQAEGKKPHPKGISKFVEQFVNNMVTGPDWCGECVREYARYIIEDVAGSLKRALVIWQEAENLNSAEKRKEALAILQKVADSDN